MRSRAIVDAIAFGEYVGSTSERRSQTPQASWRIQAKSNLVVISSHIDRCPRRATLQADIIGEFDIEVPAWPLSSAMSKIETAEVTLEVEDSTLSLRAGFARFTLRSMAHRSPLQQRLVDEQVEPSTIFVNDTLLRAVRVAAIAAFDEEPERPHLRKVSLELNRALVVAGRNDHASAKVILQPVGPVGAQWQGSSRAGLLQDALRFVGSSGSEVGVVATERHVEFSTLDAWMQVPTIPTGPMVARLPADIDPYQVTLDRHALQRALEQVSILEFSGSHVELTFDGTTLVIMSDDRELGHVLVEVPVDSDFAAPPFRVNRRILREWLQANHSPHVLLAWDAGSLHRTWTISDRDFEAELTMSLMW